MFWRKDGFKNISKKTIKLKFHKNQTKEIFFVSYKRFILNITNKFPQVDRMKSHHKHLHLWMRRSLSRVWGGGGRKQEMVWRHSISWHCVIGYLLQPPPSSYNLTAQLLHLLLLLFMFLLLLLLLFLLIYLLILFHVSAIFLLLLLSFQGSE